MRFLYTAVAALSAAVVCAQTLNNAISIPEGQSTLDVTAGQPLTIDWTNPSSGTVTIKLVQDPITPDSGIVLESDVPASAGTATLQIPAAADVNSFQYTIQIIDDSNPSNMNFSPNFGIQGATGTAVGSQTGSATASPTGNSTASSNSTTTATNSNTTSSTSSATTTGSTTGSGSTSSTGSATTSGTTGTTSRPSTTTTASPSASQTTSAPNSNGNNAASGLKVQGGLLAMAIGLVAVL